ncbi:MAG: DUF1844 domain-containing protein [Phycisphaerales bacterium]|nr:DUF1844 domain-containing protein [Phycisphaerales bacterium]
MAEDRPSLSIDSDWKKQAQEEKRRLAEQTKQKEEAAPRDVAGRIGPAGSGAATSSSPRAAGSSAQSGQGREMPPASFATLVQSILTQVMFYLGELSARGSQPAVNLDMAKHNVDILGVLEAKTKGNLDNDEQKLLDAALYEARMRYVNVAEQYIV